MNTTISVLGCGWLGKPLACELISKGYQVLGSCTTATKNSILSSCGIVPFVIDISKKDFAGSNFFKSDILVIAIPFKNREAFTNLIAELVREEVKKVLFVSSISVYSNCNIPINESMRTNESVLAQIEQQFISNSFFETTILRFGGLFGHNRKPGNFIQQGKKIENPEGFINFIHRDDCIGIIISIIERNIWGEVFNACADTHPSRREFYLKEASKVGRTVIFNEKSDNKYKIVDSRKLKKRLAFNFKYADLMRY